ncbi:MAG TPA: pitrilysin family protein, partial [Blastocatellia bacterium]|nr:pitrilysin family protein [Blastocatellia bacterium]
WQAALEIESNRMRRTTFAREEFEPEKQVVEEELRIGLDGPWEMLENEVWATAFRQHPYHWPTVGWLQDLEAATAEDMKAYYDLWYHPRNATLVLVGDFNTAETLDKIEQLFGQVPPGPEPRELRVVEPEQRGEKRVIVKKDTPVERLLIGYHVPAVGEPDSFPLKVTETLLSHGRASRLYRRLVDMDQSVTTVKASYNDHIDPSLFYLQAELKPGFSLQSVEQAIYDEIERLKSEPLPQAELEKARRQIEADIVLSNEEPLHQAVLLGQYETIAFSGHIPEEHRGYKFIDYMLGQIGQVSAEDVARAARKYLVQDNRTVGYLIDDGRGGGGGGTPEGPASQISDLKSQISNASFRSGGRKPIVTGRKTRPRLDVERLELANGLVLLLSENHALPAVSINGIVRAGSRYEADEKAGLASLVGEMIDEGTHTRTSHQIAEMVESVGGRLATFGEYQSSGTHASVLSKDVAIGIEVVADVLMNASFPPDKVIQQVERRAAQIRSRLDVPSVQASDMLNELIFAGTPRHRPPIGYEKTVRSLNREDMVEFYRRHYVPNNTLLAIVGDIDKAEIKAMVEERFGGWATAAGYYPPDVPGPERLGASVEKFVTAKKEQVNIFIGQIGIERTNADYYTLLVMETILGSSPGFTSRIPRILRDEQGLAYSTYSNITASAGVDPGRFVAFIGTAPENLEQALGGLRREIKRIVAEPVTPEELQSAKAYLTGNFVFDFQTNSQIAEFLVDSEIYGLGYDYLEKYPELIRAVGVEEVFIVTRQHLDPERLATVVVGPVDERGRILNRD